MKKLFILLIVLLPALVFAQHTTIKHKYYTTVFDEQKHIPFVVEYTLTKDMLACEERVERTNNFKADPELRAATSLKKDYKGSGYDQGHNMPAEDNRCSEEGMEECFYYSNMFPQTAKLNRGVWKMLEGRERIKAMEYGKVEVYIGSYGQVETIGPDSVVVPEYCWKVIYSNGRYEAYSFPNTTTVTGRPDEFKTTLKEIEQHTGYKFSEN